MTDLVPAEGPILAEIRASTYDIWSDGLDRPGYGRYDAAQLATPWARRRLRRTALVDGSTVLASAKEYRFDAALDGRAIRRSSGRRSQRGCRRDCVRRRSKSWRSANRAT